MTNEHDFQKFIDAVHKLPIADVLAKFKINLSARDGRNIKSIEHDSLVVDTIGNRYFWNSRNHAGDVISFVQNHLEYDFNGACEWLAREFNLALPTTSKHTMTQRIAHRRMLDVFEIAARYFHALMRGGATTGGAGGGDFHSAGAEYCRARGWSDETIHNEFLGWTGNDWLHGLRAEFGLYQVDLNSPTAVAFVGYDGDVAGWCKRNGITPREHWLKNNRIPGFNNNSLVYVHREYGRITYFATRSIDQKVEKQFAKKNIDGDLTGLERQVYYNSVYTPKSKRLVIVEGQADAIALGQLGVAAMALAGLGTKRENFELLAVALAGRHAELCVMLDSDDAGIGKRTQLALGFGAMTRIASVGDGKDAADWVRAGATANDFETSIKNSDFALVAMARNVGALNGRDLDAAMLEIATAHDKLTKIQRAVIEPPLTSVLSPVFGNINKTAVVKMLVGLVEQARERDAKRQDGQNEKTVVRTLGGKTPECDVLWQNGILLEPVYKPDEKRLVFAVRDANGDIREMAHYETDTHLFFPPEKLSALISGGTVLFANKIGDDRSVGDLMHDIRNFIHEYVDIDDTYEMLAVFFVLFTWMYDQFTMTPYLRFLGDWGTGKSRAIETIGQLCYRAMKASGAANAAPVFRLIHALRGTLLIDEADISDSDTENLMIKIYNQGNQVGTPVLRSSDGSRNFEVEAFDVFCPKILGTRKMFRDRATESRCLTKTMATTNRDLPSVLNREFYERATQIRNDLLMYRMKYWVQNRDVENVKLKHEISGRFRQMMLPLRELISTTGTAENLQQLDDFVAQLQRELQSEMLMTKQAKTLQAILEMVDERVAALSDGESLVVTLDLRTITERTNQIIDDENSEHGDDEPDDEKQQGFAVKKTSKKLTARGVGALIREHLNLPIGRATDRNRASYIVWNPDTAKRIETLRKRYGYEERMHEYKSKPTAGGISLAAE